MRPLGRQLSKAVPSSLRMNRRSTPDTKAPLVRIGFLDAGGRFTHTEYELAYFEIWGTVEDAFFEVNTQVHPFLEGYEVRRMVYWLHTLLVHVFCFKTQNYVSATERLARQLAGFFTL